MLSCDVGIGTDVSVPDASSGHPLLIMMNEFSLLPRTTFLFLPYLDSITTCSRHRVPPRPVRLQVSVRPSYKVH